MKVYFISGLAADRSVFKHIVLPSSFEPIYLDWIEPEKNESLSHYSFRMAKPIKADEAFCIIGLSMGGMLAVEIANHLHPAQTILISSIPSSQHLPVYYRFLGHLRLHKIMPIGLIQKAAILKRLFTTESLEDKRMLKAMIRRSNVPFIRWAMGAILNWKCVQAPEHLSQIHGTNDEILPRRFTKPTHVIAKGGHLMVMNRADDVNKVLAEILSPIASQQ